MSKCKYAKYSGAKGYATCDRDNSLRKKPCQCPHYKESLWGRIKKWFSKHFY